MIAQTLARGLSVRALARSAALIVHVRPNRKESGAEGAVLQDASVRVCVCVGQTQALN